jgi:hypothetical protein
MMEENIRFYLENCDFIEGFHFFADLYNGYGGFW